MDKDEYILNRLLSNARISLTKLAKELNISATAVKKRIKKLEKEGIILAYTTILNPSKTLAKIHVYAGLDIENNKYVSVIYALENIKEIRNAYATTGGHDILIELFIDEKEFKKTLRKIEKIDGVKKVCAQVLSRKLK